MDIIIKSFTFSAEDITLTLEIRKEVYKKEILMYLAGSLTSTNKELTVKTEKVGKSTATSTNLMYKDSSFLLIEQTKKFPYKTGQNFIWDPVQRGGERITSVLSYTTLEEYVDRYKNFREDISKISEYFYNSIREYKEIKMLYETSIDDVYFDKKNN